LLAATLLSGLLGWRAVFYITGSLGLILAVVIFFGVKEAPRGQSEPEMAELEQVGVYKFDKKIALGLFKKRSLLLLFAQGFVGVFPWQVITYWFFRYLETERNYDSQAVLITLAPAILVMAAGYFIGGMLGDLMFKRTPRGRLIVAIVGVLIGAILLAVTLNIPIENQSYFLVMMMLTALFIPFSSPNVISTVYDITLPEVRSTALAIQYFLENGGAATAPLLAGFIARSYSLHVAILTICVTAWILTAILLFFSAYLVPKDIQTLREQMEERAEIERTRQSSPEPV
ncbi:MAG: MFS transporter, partial [Chloroflexota bacterium]